MKDLSEDEKKLALKIALYLSRGLQSNEIAKKLLFSETRVHDLKTNAEEDLGYIKTRLTDKVPRKWLKEVERNRKAADEAEDSMRQALHKSGKPLPQICVMDGEDGEHEEFLKAAARCVCDFINKQKPKYIGVLWGNTVSRLVKTMTLLGEIRTGECRAIPLCGDPLFNVDLMIQGYSASHVAHQLEDAFLKKAHSHGGASHFEPPPTLAGVPAYIGQNFDREQVMRFVKEFPGYRKILGRPTDGKPALIHSVEMTLSGVGGFLDSTKRKSRVGTFLQERCSQDGHPDVDELEELVVGDFAGILLPRDGLSNPQLDVVKKLNDGWMGASAEQLLQIANSVRNKKPGNVLICSNAQRAEAIWKAVEMTFVNTLIISPSVAERLKVLADKYHAKLGAQIDASLKKSTPKDKPKDTGA